jgi:anti-sigma factor RsiW
MSSVRDETAEDASGCPDDETLAVYLEGGLAPARRTRLETHMSDCDRCLELLSVLIAGWPHTCER